MTKSRVEQQRNFWIEIDAGSEEEAIEVAFARDPGEWTCDSGEVLVEPVDLDQNDTAASPDLHLGSERK